MANTVSVQFGCLHGILAVNDEYNTDNSLSEQDDDDVESPVLKYFFDRNHSSRNQPPAESRDAAGSSEQDAVQLQLRTRSVLGPCHRGLSLQAWRNVRNRAGQVSRWPEVLQQVLRGGVDPILRPQVWPLLLGCAAPLDGYEQLEAAKALAEREWFRLQMLVADDQQAEKQYQEQGAVESWDATKRQVVTDTVRVDREAEPFRGSNRANSIARLESVLYAYALLDPVTGYCQGMTDLAAPFLQVFEKDWQAFWCFKGLMHRISENFHEGMQCVKARMQRVRQLLLDSDPTLFQHLVKLGADGCEITFQMVLLMLRREVCWHNVFMLWEILWASEQLTGCNNFLVYCVAAVFLTHREAILEMGKPEQLVNFVNGLPRPMDVVKLCADAMLLYKQDVCTAADMAVRCLSLTSPSGSSFVQPSVRVRGGSMTRPSNATAAGRSKAAAAAPKMP